ncbi:hypothetical protein EDD18DRAFT_1197251 [Armillaria luteobubalina]|uniref:Uncharacterized protein n=1 Tax=Armillaria luteobubalina TaxID=153913 RepID=A0AA39UCP9_9AGAR|nr:hypothetical protein EDD18DRAFT_1197251 [Armillaria luteobubalina]
MHLLSPSNEQESSVLHIIRDARGHTSVSSPIETVDNVQEPFDPTQDYAIGRCPTPALELALLLSSAPEADPPSHYEYIELWRSILIHFFPEHSIVSEWEIPFTSDHGSYPSDYQTVSLAVFPLDQVQPLVLVQVSSQADFNNPHLRDAAAVESSQLFDYLAPYSEYPQIMVIAAMGMGWRAIKRSAFLSSDEAESAWLNTTRQREESTCEWMDNVVSQVSWEVLENLVDSVKSI